MKVYDTRSILDSEPKKVICSVAVQSCFEAFMDIVRKNNIELNKFDVFYAGYILSNPILREELVKNKMKEKEIEEKRR